MRTPQEIISHKKSCKILEDIFLKIPKYIQENNKNSSNITEYQLQKRILTSLKQINHILDKDPPIVAFGSNTSLIHYFSTKQSSKTLEEWDLILVDIWAKDKTGHSPFADITQMFYYWETLPEEIKEIFKNITDIRDKTLDFIQKKLTKKELPTWQEIWNYNRQLNEKLQYTAQETDNYYLGHSIGFYSAHWKKKNISSWNNKPLIPNLGYTIEPGLYFENKFWIRSEINFYITLDFKLEVTTSLQKKIILNKV